MRTVGLSIIALAAATLAGLPAAQRAYARQAAQDTSTNTPAAGETEALRREIETLKKTIAALEARLAAQEQHSQAQQGQEASASSKDEITLAELRKELKDLDDRVSQTERGQALDRISFTGDYRFEAHTIRGSVPAHYDGMQMQSLVVRTMFASNILGRMPQSVDEINGAVTNHLADYQAFANGMSFNQLKQAMGSFSPQMQQQLFGMLMPSTFVPGYSANNDILYTNRLRLNFNAKVADNVSFTGRLSMYKAFGDSTGVQVFNGQSNSLNIDGTTAGVPNSDMLRVERAYFSWNRIGGSNLYLSIGRRPSTEGPPMNFRQDELRGGTPSGALIDFQFDGITLGYNVSDNVALRLCYGLGYESGFGNGDVLRLPGDRLKDAHFLGANLDLWSTDRTLIQATYAHAFNVTDGFNGLMVLPNNPVTGEPVGAPVVMRFTPSLNLGGIHLFGINATRRANAFDLYFSGNLSSTRPNGQTSPFGGLMSDPFETPENRSGYMVLAGIRYNVPANDERTKIGFEFNHGSRYWFNFAQASDDIIAPKTNTRGDVYEAYLTHRINDHFIFKADYIKYAYKYSGSGWHVGAPKLLDSRPLLGFPTYDGASKFAIGLTTRF
jgi:hypothetical protein